MSKLKIPTYNSSKEIVADFLESI